MRAKYLGHDGILNHKTIDSWILSAPDTRRILFNVRSNFEIHSMYLFKDVTIDYWCSGDHKDGAPIELKINGGIKSNYDSVCDKFEEVFPRLKRTYRN
ncbi:hypothetical protein HN385_03035 [archaeon]|jgi:hypothetical protein|nr:hypothetical protein [archaeon]MBT3450837.1 hypothetical protein [archaeon]MBT6868454.1 hypothetical protein [archaeon]MBT7193553.1 hypothetical protein [archaeon]MBT7381252.1 hypothetical protein [archaeon]